jgi:drug/metabolite transporter (DMT)-like permease
MTQRIPPRALVLLPILWLVWGTNWPLFPLATREVSVWTFRAVSVFFAGAALLIAARLMGQSLAIPRRHWRTITVATFFYLVVWNIASTYSALLIPSGQSAVLGFTMPLWSALISWAVLGERLSGRLVLAIALGTAAVTLLMWRSFAAYAQAPLGLALGLMAGVGWAIGTLILQRGRVQVPATVLTGWQLLITALPIGIGALVFGDHQWFVPSWTSIALIAYITLVPMCIGNLCWFSIVGLVPAHVAGLSSILVPMVAMVSGALMHGEPLGPVQGLAMVCSAAAMWLALFRPARPVPAEAPIEKKA